MTKVLPPRLEAKYEVFSNETFTLEHCVGIDRSEMLMIRVRVRVDNNLVWVGRSPNIAAKLCTIRDYGYPTFITADAR